MDSEVQHTFMRIVGRGMKPASAREKRLVYFSRFELGAHFAVWRDYPNVRGRNWWLRVSR